MERESVRAKGSYSGRKLRGAGKEQSEGKVFGCRIAAEHSVVGSA
jgi:hypothetical protein